MFMHMENDGLSVLNVDILHMCVRVCVSGWGVLSLLESCSEIWTSFVPGLSR